MIRLIIADAHVGQRSRDAEEMSRLIGAAADAGVGELIYLGDSFQYLIDEFLELLYRRDVLPMDSKERFDHETQKAIKVVYSGDESRDYKVRQVLKRGFTRGGRILRPEEVVINRFQPEDAGSGSSGDDS